MKSIDDLSWNEISFFSKLKLFFKSQNQQKVQLRSNDLWVQAQGYSALSSTYHSIYCTAFSQLKVALRPKWLALVRIVLWCLTWLPLATWCYLRALPLSNRMIYLVGYVGATADMLDIRQSVLRSRRQYDKAKKCIHIALTKNSEKAHTRGLLHVGLAEIFWYEGYWLSVLSEIEEAVTEAGKAEKQDPRQAARIYRHCADLSDLVNEALFMGDTLPGEQLREKAKAFVQQVGAKDQMLKL